MFDLDATQLLAVQLGRPLAPWWETYYVIPGADGPDRFLVAEVKAFIEQLRLHSNRVFGAGLRSDQIAILLSAAGMLADDMADLNCALRQIADWHDRYSPRLVRLGIAQEIRANCSVPRIRSNPQPIGSTSGRSRKGMLTRIRERFAPTHYQRPRPGERRFRIGSSRLLIGIGEDAEMHLGVVIDGAVWMISVIDDRGDRDPRPVPEPTPELVA